MKCRDGILHRGGSEHKEIVMTKLVFVGNIDMGWCNEIDLMSLALVTVPSVVATELKLTEPLLWAHIGFCSGYVGALSTDNDFESVRSLLSYVMLHFIEVLNVVL